MEIKDIKIVDENFEKISKHLKEELSGITEILPIAWQYVPIFNSDNKPNEDKFELARIILIKKCGKYHLIKYSCVCDKDWNPSFAEEKLNILIRGQERFWFQEGGSIDTTIKPYSPVSINGTEIYKIPRYRMDSFVYFKNGSKILCYNVKEGKTKHFEVLGKESTGPLRMELEFENGFNYLTAFQNNVILVTVIQNEKEEIIGISSKKICTIPSDRVVESLEVVDNNSAFEPMTHLLVIVNYKDGKKALLGVTEDLSKSYLSEPLDYIKKTNDIIVHPGATIGEDGWDFGFTFTIRDRDEAGGIFVSPDLRFSSYPNIIKFQDLNEVETKRLKFLLEMQSKSR